MGLPIVVFSHLRWNFVFQRPQHILSRLAKDRRILFIEEPLPVEAGMNHPNWKLTQPHENITICQTHLGSPGDVAFNDEQIPVLRQRVQELLQQQRILNCLAWFYAPMAAPLVSALTPEAIVYDCMDELSAFLHAPAQLVEREKQLLKMADVVFTGGRSIYRRKRALHHNVHCFPSSVDAAHFATAKSCEEASDQKPLPSPRLGYFGVIDERLDLDLIDEMARQKPSWHIVMVGPVVKIDPKSLPRRSNIHYFGQRAYQELPGYLRGWDVCLLPFALNDATRFISPTKTLEYMAAEKPIVSTPITDVAEPYGEIVRIGRSLDEFINACQAALADADHSHAKRVEGMRRVLAATSWDRTVQEMQIQIEAVLPHSKIETSKVERTKVQNSKAKIDESVPVIVIGAGPTGLSATYHLGEESLLIEKNDSVGGWCRSFVDNGFTFDWAGHIMFSNDEYVHKMYKMLLGDNVHWQDREAFIYSKGVYTRYPFQGCLYGLPADVITECIMGAIEARFGSLDVKIDIPDAVSAGANGKIADATAKLHGGAISTLHANGLSNGHAHNGSNGDIKGTSGTVANGKMNNGHCISNGKSNGHVKDCCADGISEAEIELHAPPVSGSATSSKSEPRNFEEFIYKVWGKGIARHFAIPYNKKLWAVPLHEMDTSWLGGRVPMPNIEEMIRYSLTPAAKPMGPNARFGYPLHGGFQSLMNGFLPHIKDRVRLNSAIVNVSPKRHTITLDSGETLHYEQLISTMPLPLLIQAMGDEAPIHVRKAAEGLRYVSVRCVNIGVGKENLTEKHWVYYPEDTVFHRIFFQGNASPHCNPPGGFGLTCEITYSPSKPLPCEGDDLIKRCIEDCKKVKLFTDENPILAANQIDMPFAYVVYDHDRPRNVAIIREWLEANDICAAGRYGQWEYFNSDHAFITGKRAAETVQQWRSARVEAGANRTAALVGGASS